MLVEVNEWGCGLPWDDGIAYLQYALVVGSDGDHYVAVRANTNVDPTTDSNNSDWAPLVPAGGTTFDASAIVSGVLDVAHIPNLSGNKITSGTVNAARISSAIARLALAPDVHGQPAGGYASPDRRYQHSHHGDSPGRALTGGRW